ncbi:MAG: lanthionine synthetase C family protein [Bacteroidales bacterium]
MNPSDAIERKLAEIYDAIGQSSAANPNYGLLSGLGGKALFLYHYEKYNQNMGNGYSISALDNLKTSITQYKGTSSFCSGIAGVCYVLNRIDNDSESNVLDEEEIRDYLSGAVHVSIQNHKYEFLYGLMGIAACLIKAPEVYYASLLEILDFLEDSKEETESGGYRWKQESKEEYNLSMSHGMASIYVILSKLYQIPLFEPRRQQIGSLLTGGIRYLLSQQMNVSEYGSYFSYVSDKKGPDLRKTRLAWCYGDLGISTALWQAGKALDCREWLDRAEKIALFAAHHRRNLKDNLVIDAGLCHGTAGIAGVFYRMWWNTGNPVLKEVTDYWIRQTLEMAHYEYGLAGYLALGPSHRWQKLDNLLEGISGIGLVLLFYLQNEEPIWDECLLIS